MSSNINSPSQHSKRNNQEGSIPNKRINSLDSTSLDTIKKYDGYTFESHFHTY